MKRGINLLFVLTLLSIKGLGQSLPTAMETYNSMTIGWNIGNTMEAIGGETAWGNPLVTQQLIDSVKAAGFNTIRIPCSWDKHADQTTLQIDPTWMARVKQIVDYCINRNLYVILNIHWDGGWLENNVTPAMQASVNVKQNAYWAQIANTFKNYDGHLLFASANEPNVSDATQMTVLLSYHQTFIDAVRATGGNNSSRVLVIQGPGTDIDKTNQLMNTLPTDNIPNRLMVEVHDYSPYNFCLMTADASWGNMFYYWGTGYHSSTDLAHNPTWGEESFLESYFNLMKTKFVDNCIPVIIGEFGAMKRTSLTGSALSLHIASREYFYQYTSNAARRYGMRLLCWDTGYIGDNSMTLFNRNTGAVVDQGAVNALMNGFATGTDPSTACSPLPVEFLYFTGENMGSTTILHWATSFEIESGYFEIMRSFDGNNWSKIGQVTSVGNSNGVNEYFYTDSLVTSDKTYYKIIERDLNGGAKNSPIISVDASVSTAIKIIPNPNNGAFYIVADGFEGKGSINIYDPLGKVVYSHSADFTNPNHKEYISDILFPGIYLIELRTPDKVRVGKVIVK